MSRIVDYSSKECKRCLKAYKPNSSIQKVCFDCRNDYKQERRRAWRKENLERDNDVRRKWYWNNLELVRTYKQNWNKTKGIKYREEYYQIQENRLKRNEISKRYRKDQKNRINARILFKKSGQKLECFCKESGRVEVHHIDGDTSNNSLDNLTPLCVKHHKWIHFRKRLEQSHIPTLS